MGTNYYAVKNRPTVCSPIHIGKSSSGWLFLFHEQNDPTNKSAIGFAGKCLLEQDQLFRDTLYVISQTTTI